jgi:hypothetical protein
MTRFKQRGHIAEYAMFAYLALWAAAALGYVLNVVRLFGMVHEPVTALFIIRIIGVFTGVVGASVGWIPNP